MLNKTIDGMTLTVEVTAINLVDRQIMLADGTILPMTTLHELSGEETDDIEDAAFATVLLPNGKWVPIVFAEYEEPRALN